MRTIIISTIASIFLSASCDGELRGTSTKSSDNQTYLIIEADDGWECDSVFIDGKHWPHKAGVSGKIEPGEHSITCGGNAENDRGIGFEIKEGTTFHFDYWGP